MDPLRYEPCIIKHNSTPINQLKGGRPFDKKGLKGLKDTYHHVLPCRTLWIWLVVSTHLKTISQIGSSPQIRFKKKKIETTTWWMKRKRCELFSLFVKNNPFPEKILNFLTKMVRGFWKKRDAAKTIQDWLVDSTFPKTNSLHLESDGWKTILSFSGPIFGALAVSFRWSNNQTCFISWALL